MKVASSSVDVDPTTGGETNVMPSGVKMVVKPPPKRQPLFVKSVKQASGEFLS